MAGPKSSLARSLSAALILPSFRGPVFSELLCRASHAVRKGRALFPPAIAVIPFKRVVHFESVVQLVRCWARTRRCRSRPAPSSKCGARLPSAQRASRSAKKLFSQLANFGCGGCAVCQKAANPHRAAAITAHDAAAAMGRAGHHQHRQQQLRPRGQ